MLTWLSCTSVVVMRTYEKQNNNKQNSGYIPRFTGPFVNKDKQVIFKTTVYVVK